MSSASPPARQSMQGAAAPRGPSRRAFWLKQLHQWHWISSAICLLGMLLFAITGLTLNNAARIESKPRVVTRQATLPADVLAAVNQAIDQAATQAINQAVPQAANQAQAAAQASGQSAGPSAGPGAGRSRAGRPAVLPAPLADWLRREWDIDADGRAPEWSPGEVYISLPRPGGDAWASIDLKTGEAEYEVTSRGWIAYLNDLHKGRNTGHVWSWFIDIFAVACLLFSLTGLLLLKMHAAKRAATWPIVGLGVLIPLLLALVFIH